MESNNITEELLFRHFDGQLSPEQDQLVLKWKESSPENHKEYQNSWLFYKDATALESIRLHEHRYNPKKAWTHFRTNHAINRSSTKRNTWLKIAASVILLLGLSWLMADMLKPAPVVLTSNEITSISLEDGSQITLNEGSRLTYPEKFTKKERRVTLTGEAYFEVEKDPEKPFLIQVTNAEIEVLGTSFNVKEINDEIVVAVDEGLVRMSNDDQEIYLEAGTRGILDSQLRLHKEEETKILTDNFWKTKRLAFRNNTLKDVAIALEKVYAIRVKFDNDQLEKCTISVDFQNQEVEQIMEVISTTLNITIINQQNVYHIDGKNSCN